MFRLFIVRQGYNNNNNDDDDDDDDDNDNNNNNNNNNKNNNNNNNNDLQSAIERKNTEWRMQDAGWRQIEDSKVRRGFLAQRSGSFVSILNCLMP